MHQFLKWVFKYPNATITRNGYNTTLLALLINEHIPGYFDTCKLQLYSKDDMTGKEQHTYQELCREVENSDGRSHYYDTKESIDYCRENNFNVDNLFELGIAQMILNNQIEYGYK